MVFTLLILVASCQAKTLVVDPTGTEDAKTLPAAIGMARPGDEVMVEAGEYSGAIVDRSISILGRGQVLVKGTLTVTAPGCKVSKLSIQADGSDPAIVLQSRDNVLEGCEVRGAARGILVSGQNNTLASSQIQASLGVELLGSRSRILNSTFQGEEGIKIKNASENTVQGCRFSGTRGMEIESATRNRIENNSFSGMGFGMTLTKCSGNWINGNNLSGTYVSGLDVMESSGNNLTRNTITGAKVGISLRRSDNNSLISNACRTNERAGIYSDSSVHNYFEANELSGNGNGILLTESGNNSLISNYAYNNTYGISLRGAQGNILRNNTLKHNAYNLRIDAGEASSTTLVEAKHDLFLQEIDSSNLADGKPICYLVGKSHHEVPPGCGFVGLVGCSNILVSNQTISNSSAGVLLVDSTACSIENVSLANVETGFYLLDSSAFSVMNSRTLHGNNGFLAAGSSEGLMEGNMAANCSADGFRAESSLHLAWRNCSALYCNRGIYLTGSRLCEVLNCSARGNKEAGIMLINSHKCSLDGNEAVGNEKGIALSGSNACTISKNNASANQNHGLSLEQLSGAEIQENAARFNVQGLFAQSSSRLLIQGNNLSENSRFGLRMSSTSASNVTLNSFVHNQFSGANLVDCKGNFLYHNIFIENGIQNAADNGTNQWDAGTIAGGNYWSDHAVQGNPGNVPRQIPSGGVDRYPFQDLWGWR